MEPRRRETADTEPIAVAAAADENPVGALLADGMDDFPTRTGGETIEVVLLRRPPDAVPPLAPGSARPADDCECEYDAIAPDADRAALDDSVAVDWVVVAVLIVRWRGWTSPVMPALERPAPASGAEGVIAAALVEVAWAEARLESDEMLVRGLREPLTGLAAVNPFVTEEGGEMVEPAFESEEVDPDCGREYKGKSPTHLEKDKQTHQAGKTRTVAECSRLSDSRCGAHWADHVDLADALSVHKYKGC